MTQWRYNCFYFDSFDFNYFIKQKKKNCFSRAMFYVIFWILTVCKTERVVWPISKTNHTYWEQWVGVKNIHEEVWKEFF